MNFLKKMAVMATVVSSALIANSAYAVSVVTAGVTTQIADVNTDQVAVGGLVIASAAIAFGINWVKATFF